MRKYTKKTYEGVANVLKEARAKMSTYDFYTGDIVDMIIDDFIELFREDNSSFNEDKFRHACIKNKIKQI